MQPPLLLPKHFHHCKVKTLPFKQFTLSSLPYPPILSSLSPWQSPIYGFITTDLSILDISYKWNHIIFDLLFWLLSLSIIFSKFTLLVACSNTSFLFMAEYVSLTNSVQFSRSVQFSSVWLCNPMDSSMPGLPVHHQLLEFTQTRVHWVSNAIQPSYPLSSPSPPAFNLSQHQGLFLNLSKL